MLLKTNEHSNVRKFVYGLIFIATYTADIATSDDMLAHGD